MKKPNPIPLIVLVRDLIFASKIITTAKSLNVPMKLLRDPAHLAAETASRRLIVDLNQDGIMDSVVSWKQANSGEVIGFVSHVDHDTIVGAKAVGIDQILPRSVFVERLEQLLRPVD